MSIFDTLPNDRMLVIHCQGSNQRNRIHAYLDKNCPDLGHIGVLIPEYSHGHVVLKECPRCDRVVGVDCSKPRKDQWYLGYCSTCDESVNYEPRYEDENYRTSPCNNVICVGSFIKLPAPFRSQTFDVKPETLQKLLSKTYYFSVIAPEQIFTGSRGKKSKKRLNKKKDVLVEHIRRNVAYATF